MKVDNNLYASVSFFLSYFMLCSCKDEIANLVTNQTRSHLLFHALSIYHLLY